MAGASPSDLLTALRRFGLANDRLDAAVARRLGASPVEFKAMDHLHNAGELTPGQLADRLSLSTGAITALVDRLERLGWVERAPHPDDRRSVIVRPLADADGEVPQIYEGFAGELRRLARKLSPAERAALSEFLNAAGDTAARRAAELHEQPRPR